MLKYIVFKGEDKCEWIEFYYISFFKGAQVGGRTWDLFDFRLFSLTSSALDHSATAPPLISYYLSISRYRHILV